MHCTLSAVSSGTPSPSSSKRSWTERRFSLISCKNHGNQNELNEWRSDSQQWDHCGSTWFIGTSFRKWSQKLFRSVLIGNCHLSAHLSFLISGRNLRICLKRICVSLSIKTGVPTSPGGSLPETTWQHRWNLPKVGENPIVPTLDSQFYYFHRGKGCFNIRKTSDKTTRMLGFIPMVQVAVDPVVLKPILLIL